MIGQRQAEVDSAIPLVCRSSLIREVGLMKGDDFGAVEAQPSSETVDDRRETARFADDDALPGDAGVVAEPLEVSDFSDGLLSGSAARQSLECGDGFATNHSV